MSDPLPRDPTAVAAALRVGARFGFSTERPVVLQETNNSVVWLRPHDVVAKVGRWGHSGASLLREHVVASALVSSSAPVVRPIAEAAPTRDDPTGYVITLWERLEGRPGTAADPRDVGASLRALHRALERYDADLPSFEASLDLAEAVVRDDAAMAALRPTDRSLLRRTFERLRSEVRARAFAQQPLHGEPHDGNLLVTPAGLRWIDLEGVCAGPLEWDLAFLPEPAVDRFPEADLDLLALLRTLNSARVATWCFARAEFEELRWHGDHHLGRVREAAAERRA